ncbi:MAG: hypothetical protein FJ039_06915 [Chloroflexi bacterium]|nr:hypothetical protein [Chloroflexota bacterium]
MSLDHTLYVEDVQEGQEIPTFQRQTDLMHWNRFAAVNDEFVQIHMDDEAAKKAGMTGAFGMGNLRYAYILNMLRAWAGINGDIRRLDVQHRAISYKHDVLTAKGKVTKKYAKDGKHFVDLDVEVTNQKNEKTTLGTATVEMPSKMAHAKAR